MVGFRFGKESLTCSLSLIFSVQESVSRSFVSDSCATPWTLALQAPLSVEFYRQEYCSGLPFPSPAGLPKKGIETGSPALQTDSLPSEPPGYIINSLVVIYPQM